MKIDIEREGTWPIFSVLTDRGESAWLWIPEGGPPQPDPELFTPEYDKAVVDALCHALELATRYRRLPTSPTGDHGLFCKEPVIFWGLQKTCRHSWADHDDDGCLWYDCTCTQPGERK